MSTLALALLAEFNNPQGFDNGQHLKELLEAQGQGNWIMFLATGALLFIAFSSRFKR